MGGYGFEVCFPLRPGGDRLLIDALEKLPLPTWSGAAFDTLSPGAFGVVPVGERDPIYTSASRDDAIAALNLLNARTKRNHAVIPVDGAPSRWLVVGPAAGPYISCVEVVPNEATARRRADVLSTKTGETFLVARSL